MTKRSRYFVAVIGLTLLIVATVAGLASPVANGIDSALSAATKQGDVPGVVAVAADRSGVIYKGGFGLADVASKRPMAPDAIFRIASMTKAVTSAALMQLIEQGKIGLEDPAGKYLPELAQMSVFESFDSKTGDYKLRPAKKAITVRHLLTHTSGLGYGFVSPIIRDFKPRPGEQYPAGVLLFEPGEGWHYGTSTDYVGRLVEKVSGQNLEEYFRAHIFEPLGMHDTFFNIPQDKQSRLVTNYQRGPAGLVEQPQQAPRTVTTFNGGGGLSSTASDYLIFLQMLLNKGELKGARVLSAATVTLMGQNHIGSVGVGAMKTAMPDRSNDFTFINDGRDKWGLGFLITTQHVAGKRDSGSLSWGGIDNTYFWLDPKSGVAGVIMMQLLPFSDTKALALYDSFERGVYKLANLKP